MSGKPSSDTEAAADSETGGTEVDSSAAQAVKTHMLMALAVGLVPIPLIDVAGLTAIQLRLLSRLSSLYKVEFSDQLGKSVIGSLLGAGGSFLASSAASSLLFGLIPVAGWVVSALNSSVFAGASTYAVGKVFSQHFASGGTFLTFDPEKVREYYAQQFQQGTVEVADAARSFAGVKP